jgi:hypothetical protein
MKGMERNEKEARLRLLLGVMHKCGLHPGSLIQTSSDGIAGGSI